MPPASTSIRPNPSSVNSLRVAVIGSGPAGLMAADQLSQAGFRVSLFEKKSGPGRKLLIAGSSGLNITYDSPLAEFVKNYRDSATQFEKILEAFPPQAWIEFIEGLGVKTFKGTSRRYFVEGMKASVLLKSWVHSLAERGVAFHYQKELAGFESLPCEPAGGKSARVRLAFRSTDPSQAKDPPLFGEEFDAACFCLGGGSWEPKETPLRWPEIFKEKKIGFEPFVSSNSGFKVAWPAKFIQEAEGLPLKNIVLRSEKISRSGDAVITRYGIEGTPVYFAGVVGDVELDLKPDLTEAQILAKLLGIRENLSPLRRIKKVLQLSPAALALLFHLPPEEELQDLKRWAARIKHFPLTLQERQPLAESISSSGGISWSELTPELMLKAHPGIFIAGEMLNWDAPTGGFLIQGSVSSGFYAALGIQTFLKS